MPNNFDDGTKSTLKPVSTYGAWGQSQQGNGLVGTSDSFHGVQGMSTKGAGVCGSGSIGVRGESESIGVLGKSVEGSGVVGNSQNGLGVFGWSENSSGIAGSSKKDHGVYGNSQGVSCAGVLGISQGDYGIGVHGKGTKGIGVMGEGLGGGGLGSPGIGVEGRGTKAGVVGIADSYGVMGVGRGDGAGICAEHGSAGNSAYLGAKDYAGGFEFRGRTRAFLCLYDYAGLFHGNVQINGNLIKTGGQFKIDHPLDPANKYLNHAFVESPEMKTVYDGLALLDEKGEARVELPDWFMSLNREYRYQLTPIGGAAPNLHVAEEIADNSFKIAGGAPGLKVSWQVTGIRQDAWAEANSMPVEEDKPSDEQGLYLYPELHGAPEDLSIIKVRHSASLKKSEELTDRLLAQARREPDTFMSNDQEPANEERT